MTKGDVTAFELDNLVVEYDIGFLKFDNQVEIEGANVFESLHVREVTVVRESSMPTAWPWACCSPEATKAAPTTTALRLPIRFDQSSKR